MERTDLRSSSVGTLPDHDIDRLDEIGRPLAGLDDVPAAVRVAVRAAVAQGARS